MTRQMVFATVPLVVFMATGSRRGAEAAEPCADPTPTIVGDGAGTVFGTGGADVIVHADGVAETIFAYGGNDVVCAGQDDVVYGGSGDDYLFGHDGETAAAMYGQSGNDWVLWGSVLEGGSGGDHLLYGAELAGGSGNDVLVGGTAGCDGGSGADTASDCALTANVP